MAKDEIEHMIEQMSGGPRFMADMAPKRTQDRRAKVAALHAMTRPGEMLPPGGIRLLHELRKG